MITYQYDNLGRETAENWDNGHGIFYYYDADSRLLWAVDEDPTNLSSDGFVYNAVGQVTTQTQWIDGLQYIDGQTPSVTLSSQYDAVGDRTQLSATIGTTADLVNNYSYDYLGRLQQTTQQGAAGSDAVAPKRVAFTYNADNQFSTITRYNAVTAGSEVATAPTATTTTAA